MRLLVGLGNPGARYHGTRHNVGFEAADRIATMSGGRWNDVSEEAVSTDVMLEGRPVTILKPLTYMNRSGRAVAEAVAKSSLEPHDVLVIFDDVALPLGTLRLRERGSDGGHNGLASVMEALDSRDVPRLRIGIRPEGLAADELPEDLVDFVLAPFDESERPRVDEALDRVVAATRAVLADGMTKAMSRFNRPPENEQL